MVPFVEAVVSASPIVWFDGLDASAERAISVGNNTTKPLPAGPLAVYGRGGFLGEAMLVDLKPGDRQFAHIADEPDASIRSSRPTTIREFRHVEFDGDELRTHYFRTSTRHVSFNNQSGRARKAYVALPSVLNATVAGCESVDFERSSARAFAVFDLPPGKGKRRTLVIKEAVSSPHSLQELQHADLQEIVETSSIENREREVVRASIPLLDQWRVVEREASELDTERKAIETKLERLRKHLDALAKSESGAAHGQLVKRILEREDELSANEAARRVLGEREAAARAAFEQALDGLSAFREEIIEQRKRAARGS
jgi:hypothetical protein